MTTAFLWIFLFHPLSITPPTPVTPASISLLVSHSARGRSSVAGLIIRLLMLGMFINQILSALTQMLVLLKQGGTKILLNSLQIPYLLLFNPAGS